MSSQSATPSAPLFFSHTPPTQLLLHSALSSAELFAAFTPPVYLISTLVLRRRPFSIRRLMYNSMGGVLAGAAVGGGYAYLRGWREGELKVRERVARVAMDETQVRRNDYATISAALSALLVPAVFLNRARLPVLVLGGGSIGLGVGAAAFVVERLTKGQDTGVNMPGDEKAL
ncbi:hypothetical protein I315_05593 [Cryptococcus gattii Ru294]|nr:hypothetical protein I315_05593 [Cryptococcus gattii Ru294]